MSKTKIMLHSCISPVQDKLHGVGRRVFNAMKKTTPNLQRFRCTVCERIVEIRLKEDKKDKEQEEANEKEAKTQTRKTDKRMKGKGRK